MSEFNRQFAIWLPSGSLFNVPKPEPSPFSFFGRSQSQHQPRVMVFETEEDAKSVLAQLQNEASKVGVLNLGASIVSRVVGPWADPDLTGFMRAVEEHANGAES
ncbi:hypothetical protein [Rhodococcus sp. YH3-3]|uniref:hypothetical protein n=1 Tax=Rhodococcus sp. YH3-3 TaxID=1803579 RepID=UPI0007DB5803|nr:hypothetical protein [Rhodococcus sp. YH3-3]